MKAHDFAYAKPASLAEALELLARPGARALAGGQSLIPSLNLRLSAPELLVDITALRELGGVTARGDRVRVGALVTHARIESSGELRRLVPLLAEAARHVAHPAIRNRGTLGGSLALADPAAEYPACAVALDSVLVLESKAGRRKVKAEEFFKGLFETDLAPGELVVAAEFPAAAQGDRSAFLELARRQGDYATIGLAVHNSRFVFFGAGPRPALIDGISPQTSLRQAREAVRAQLRPAADLYNSAATKQHLAGVLVERAWNTLATSP